MNYYYLDQGDYLRMYNLLHQNHEVGGSFYEQGSRLVPKYEHRGGHDSISLDNKSKFLFHTHPGKCESKVNCSFGMPSSQDMVQIMKSAITGNLAHFVIAHEGLYIVQAECWLQKAYTKNPDEMIERVKQKFKDFQNGYSLSFQSYESFIQSWIRFANQQGFRVIYYPHGSALQFQFQDKCFF